MDRHLNVFNAYRHGNNRDTERERVLEDNVTRALMVTLQSSRSLTREFLRKFACIDSSGAYKYDLQSRLQGGDGNAKDRERISGKRLIVIAKGSEYPNSLRVSRQVREAFHRCLENSHKRLQKALSDLCDDIRNKDIGPRRIESRLKRLLGIDDMDSDGYDLGNARLAKHLYELTLGSRPDASITSRQVSVLFENKLDSDVSEVQIQRHLRESFGEGFQPEYPQYQPATAMRGKPKRVPVLLWTWSDVYEFFRSALDNKYLARNPVSRFLIKQKLDYLEGHNLGPVHFTYGDFDAWESVDNDRITGELHERIKDLGKTLAVELGNHQMFPQKKTRDYLGINILPDEFAHEQPLQVPHWSLALKGEKQLTLYVQCESKPLVRKLLKKRELLECSLVDRLCAIGDLSSLTLSVTKRLFKRRGLSEYCGYREIDLRQSVAKSEIQAAVRRVFDDMKYLDSAKAKDRIFKERENDAVPVRSINGTFGFSYIWDIGTLEEEGTSIVDRVVEVAERMRPYYEELLEVYRGK